MVRNIFILAIYVMLTQKAMGEFCIQSFNTYGPAYSSNLEGRTKKFLKLLKAEKNCSIVTLQEVWQDRHIEQLSLGLKNINSEYDVFHADTLLNGSRSGLLMASSFPITSNEAYSFINYPNGISDWFREQMGVKKAVSALLVSVSDNGITDKLIVINTHLHHSSQPIRLAQIVELGEYLNKAELKRFPLILAGDFNAQPYSLEWFLIKELLELQDSHLTSNKEYKKEDATYDENNPLSWGGPSRVLDYVFYRNGEETQLKIQSSQVFPKVYKDQYLSDHYGKKVSLDFEPINGFFMPINYENQSKEYIERALRILKNQKEKEYIFAIKALERRLGYSEFENSLDM
jgi:exonuclease III